MDKLSVAIIGPDESLRGHIVEAVEALGQQVAREFAEYPEQTTLGGAAGTGEFDVVLIDLDSDQEVAFLLVSQISSHDSTLTVMVYSAGARPEQVVRCMRAGAREYLSFPLVMSQLGEAFTRAAARRPPASRFKLARKLFVFWGAKGGVGATTLATNFAIALRAESEHHVALVDLYLQLGDVAMALSVEPQFSVVDALESGHRLDDEFLSALMIEHRSGVAVLAGPDQFIAQPVIPNGNLSLLLGSMPSNRTSALRTLRWLACRCCQFGSS
jgi:pilus assembly protein CpaE